MELSSLNRVLAGLDVAVGQIRGSRQLFIGSTEEDVMERSTEKASWSFTPRVARGLKNVSKINTHSD